jgi:hypothetical protein
MIMHASMRVLIQNVHDKLYLQGGSRWTPLKPRAFDFEDPLRALECCLLQPSPLQLQVVFELEHRDCAFPLRFPLRSEARTGEAWAGEEVSALANPRGHCSRLYEGVPVEPVPR